MTPTGNQPLTFAQFCLATGWTVNRAREFMAKPAPLTTVKNGSIAHVRFPMGKTAGSTGLQVSSKSTATS